MGASGLANKIRHAGGVFVNKQGRAADNTMMQDFKRFFLRGLAALAPTLVTLAVVVWAYRFVDQNIGQFLTRGVVWVYARGAEPHAWFGIDEETAYALGDPIDQWHAETGRRLTAQLRAMTNPGLGNPDDAVRAAAELQRREALWELARRKWMFFNLVGFLLAILLIYFMGYFLASFIGRATWRVIEHVLQRLPLIGAIYPNIKQVTDFFIADKKRGFSGVVAVQYPRKGIWAVGLVTGPPMPLIGLSDTRDLLTVFIPSSPTPITGYTITVAREDVLELPISIDEALRYTISGGVVKPGTDAADPNALVASPARSAS